MKAPSAEPGPRHSRCDRNRDGGSEESNMDACPDCSLGRYSRQLRPESDMSGLVIRFFLYFVLMDSLLACLFLRWHLTL